MITSSTLILTQLKYKRSILHSSVNHYSKTQLITKRRGILYGLNDNLKAEQKNKLDYDRPYHTLCVCWDDNTRTREMVKKKQKKKKKKKNVKTVLMHADNDNQIQPAHPHFVQE